MRPRIIAFFSIFLLLSFSFVAVAPADAKINKKKTKKISATQKKKNKKNKKKSAKKNDFFLDSTPDATSEVAKEINKTATTEKKPSAEKETGYASWYGGEFQGRPTASGEPYDMYGYTAAHKTLPLGSIVVVKNLENQRKVVVRVNDRGPFVEGRIIDLTKAAADELDFTNKGTAQVELEVIRSGDAPYAISAISRQKNIPAQDYSPSEPAEFPQNISGATTENSQPAEEPQEEIFIEEEVIEPQEELLTEDIPPKENKEESQKQILPKPEPKIVQAEGYTFADEQPTGYTIQVGAFKKEQNAINYRKKIEQEFGKKTFYAQKNDWNYVWVGDFPDAKTARDFLQKLKSKGVEVMYRGKVD